MKARCSVERICSGSFSLKTLSLLAGFTLVTEEWWLVAGGSEIALTYLRGLRYALGGSHGGCKNLLATALTHGAMANGCHLSAQEEAYSANSIVASLDS